MDFTDPLGRVWWNAGAWYALVKKAWREGNDSGKGAPVGCETDGVNDHEDELGQLISRSDGDHELAVYWDGKSLVAVGDAHGPWAVDVTEAVRLRWVGRS